MMRETAALTLRMLAGLAAAPVAAALISVGTYDLSWHAGLMPHGIPLHSLDAASPLFGGVLILAVVVTGAAAVPGVIWLNQRRWLTLGKLLVFGAVTGNFPFAVITALMLVSRADTMMTGDWFTLSGILVRIGMGVIGGAGGAATFWLVSVCGTTDAAGRSSLPLGT